MPFALLCCCPALPLSDSSCSLGEASHGQHLRTVQMLVMPLKATWMALEHQRSLPKASVSAALCPCVLSLNQPDLRSATNPQLFVFALLYLWCSHVLICTCSSGLKIKAQPHSGEQWQVWSNMTSSPNLERSNVEGNLIRTNRQTWWLPQTSHTCCHQEPDISCSWRPARKRAIQQAVFSIMFRKTSHTCYVNTNSFPTWFQRMWHWFYRNTE